MFLEWMYDGMDGRMSNEGWMTWLGGYLLRLCFASLVSVVLCCCCWWPECVDMRNDEEVVCV